MNSKLHDTRICYAGVRYLRAGWLPMCPALLVILFRYRLKECHPLPKFLAALCQLRSSLPGPSPWDAGCCRARRAVSIAEIKNCGKTIDPALQICEGQVLLLGLPPASMSNLGCEMLTRER